MQMVYKYTKSNFNLVKFTYSHYLYSLKCKFVGNYVCRSVSVNLLPITKYGYYVFALMNKKYLCLILLNLLEAQFQTMT